jgi:bifunctional non-homologous end joining protein LigD
LRHWLDYARGCRPSRPICCIIDGEAVACDDIGVACFDLVRHHRANERIFLYAFDLIELNDDDLRRDQLEGRKTTPEMILAKAGPGIQFNEHIEGDGEAVFQLRSCRRYAGAVPGPTGCHQI